MSDKQEFKEIFNETRTKLQSTMCNAINEVIEAGLNSQLGYTTADILGCLEIVKHRYATEARDDD